MAKSKILTLLSESEAFIVLTFKVEDAKSKQQPQSPDDDITLTQIEFNSSFASVEVTENIIIELANTILKSREINEKS